MVEKGSYGSRIRTCCRTDAGIREGNEDACGIFEMPHPDGAITLLAVADGLGGHPSGEVASRLAVDSMSAHISEGSKALRSLDPAEMEPLLSAAFSKANREVASHAARVAGCQGMGTTLVAALVNPQGEAVVGNVGDSRAYLIGETITRITRDHSQVWDLVELGKLSPGEAEYHPMRHIVTRIIGRPGDEPDIFRVRLDSRRLLLCSDGLTDGLDEREIFVLLQTRNIGETCETLVERAKEKSRDNITVIVAGL